VSYAQPERIELTRHASIRVRQRGVPERVLRLVLEHADITLHAGDGCEHMYLSHHQAEELIASAIAGPDEVSRARRLVAVLGQQGVTTVLRPDSGSRGRRYRRQMATRSASNSGRYRR